MPPKLDNGPQVMLNQPDDMTNPGRELAPRHWAIVKHRWDYLQLALELFICCLCQVCLSLYSAFSKNFLEAYIYS